MSKIWHSRRPGFAHARYLPGDTNPAPDVCSNMINIGASNLTNGSGDNMVFCPPPPCETMINDGGDCLVNVAGDHLI